MQAEFYSESVIGIRPMPLQTKSNENKTNFESLKLLNFIAKL